MTLANNSNLHNSNSIQYTIKNWGQTFLVCPKKIFFFPTVSRNLAGLCSDVWLVSSERYCESFRSHPHMLFSWNLYIKTPQFPPFCTFLLRTPNKTLLVSLVTCLKYERLKLSCSLCINLTSAYVHYSLSICRLTAFLVQMLSSDVAWNTNPAILMPDDCLGLETPLMEITGWTRVAHYSLSRGG